MLGNWLIGLALIAVSTGACSGSDDRLLVLGAASLRESFADIAERFEDRTGVEVDLSTGASSLLAAQISEGAPADVFASADAVQMEVALRALESHFGDAPVFATNRICIVVPADNPADIESFEDLGGSGVDLVLASEQVPAGAYALRFLRTHGLERAVDNVVSFEEDVKEVVVKVLLGEADAGIAYRTDVTPALADELTIVDLPADRSTEARYPIAALSPDPLAAEFVEFVLGQEGRSILEEHGFGAP